MPFKCQILAIKRRCLAATLTNVTMSSNFEVGFFILHDIIQGSENYCNKICQEKKLEKKHTKHTITMMIKKNIVASAL